MLVRLLENLINKKYYESKEVIENKLNVFYAMSKITDEDYSSLMLRVDEMYAIEEVTENESTEEEV